MLAASPGNNFPAPGFDTSSGSDAVPANYGTRYYYDNSCSGTCCRSGACCCGSTSGHFNSSLRCPQQWQA